MNVTLIFDKNTKISNKYMNLLLFRAVLTSLQPKQDIKIIILLLFRAVLTTLPY